MGIRSFAAELLLPAALQPRPRPAALDGTPRAEAASFAALAERLGYLSKAEIKLIREAYKFADEAHLGQFRASGEPYITHPLAVAGMVGRAGNAVPAAVAEGWPTQRAWWRP